MTECGTTCLAMIFKHYGLFNVQAALREIANVTASGSDLLTLARVAERFGFESQGSRAKFEHLSQLPLPCIAHYEGNHYVVVYKASKSEVWIADPASDKEKLPREEFQRKWNGVVLVLQPTREVFTTGDVMEIAEQYAKREKFIARSFYRSLLFPFRRILGEIILASLLLIALSLALPFFTQSIIDSVLVFQNKNLLYAILVAMMGIFLLQVVLTYTRHILMAQFRINFEFEFFSRFFKHFLQLTQSYYDSHRREDFIQRFQENLKIRNVFNAGTVQSALDIILLLSLVPVLFVYNSTLASIALSFMGLFILCTILFTPRIRRLQEKVFYENAKTMGGFVDTLLGITTVKLLAIETLKFWEWRTTYKHTLNKVLTASRTQIILNSLLRTIMFLGQISVYWIGAYITFNGGLSIGQYIAFISIFAMMMHSVVTISDLWFVLTDMSVTFARMNDVFMQEPEKADLATQSTVLNHGGIEFKNVWFSYEGSDHHVLSDVSLTIRPGEHIGVVGRNGSGKTTLVKLLVKLYEQYKGGIFIGGTELRNMHPQYLRMKVYMLPQEVYLFNGTIADNIRLANPAASNEDVIRAAKNADLHDFVRSLYLGYNQKIGESGSNLSGGQRLKVAFARLFLSDPDVIILDEASSALDVISEQKIVTNIYEHFRSKTVISIAHRLTTLQHVDRIIVLDEGRISEEGSHGELLEKQGAYYKFIRTYVEF